MFVSCISTGHSLVIIPSNCENINFYAINPKLYGVLAVLVNFVAYSFGRIPKGGVDARFPAGGGGDVWRNDLYEGARVICASSN